MPKRQFLTVDELTDWDWLCRCAARAAKGKRHRHSVQNYLDHFEESTSRVAEALRHCRLPVGQYKCFEIHDPKPRIIHAAPFPDRVAHHALIGKMAVRLERSWVHSSYACRPGKGSHAAILKAHEIAQRSPWIVKLDVHSYFAFINHDILSELLHRQFKGKALFQLIDAVLDSYCVQQGRGLPIGALTSQYFANHYLDGLQRFLRTLPIVVDELRYMDDLWIGCVSRSDAREIAVAANEWLQAHRRLSLKPACIQRSRVGMTFCGFRVSSQDIRLGKRRRRSIAQQYRQVVEDCFASTHSETDLQSRLCSITALAKPGQHRTVMQKIMESTGVNQLC